MLVMEKKVYGYARVSTTHQKTDRQVDELLKYVDERDIVVDYQSGKDMERNGYQTLRNQLTRNGDEIIITELDRLGRNKEAIKDELKFFKDKGVRVKILEIPTSLISCESNQDWILELVSSILIEVMSALAEQERLKIHERQRMGLDAAKRRGVVFGRPKLEKPERFVEVIARVEKGDISSVQAMAELGLKKTSYYKLRKMYYAKEEV